MKLTKVEQKGRVTRIQLPDGNWWDILTKPKWKHIKDLRRSLQAPAGDAELDEDQAANAALVHFTVAWSFPDDIDNAGLEERDLSDLIQALQLVNEKLSPIFEAMSGSGGAEKVTANGK